MNKLKRIAYILLFISTFLSNFKNVLGATDVQETKPRGVVVVTNNNTLTKPPTQILAEGGKLPDSVAQDETHLSREHVTEKLNITVPKEGLNIIKPIANNSKPEESVNQVPEKKAPERNLEIESGVPKKNDNSHSVGKKGVSPSDSTDAHLPTIAVTSANKTNSVTTSTMTEVTAKMPSKPRITEHDDAALILNKTKNVSEIHTPKIPNIDTLLEKKSNRADYVVPIVAVILSVPLVAIIISVLYKRGTDWWQHRNYRRMDFLIEGMYNN